ncbi:MAG: hypothetical protein QOG66_2421, partial [Methylobacteriaceae bacterium]|nr:hypothetical protein [Methylobacteriaceae bacterium]
QVSAGVTEAYLTIRMLDPFAFKACALA